MKKASKIFYFLLGLGIFSGICVYATTTFLSEDVTFTPQNTNWQASNVKEAIDGLYAKIENLVPDNFNFIWCCGASDNSTMILSNEAWPYVTFSNSSGTSSYKLVFQNDSAITLANITLDQKYEISSMPSRRIYLSCGSTSWKCLNITYSN